VISHKYIQIQFLKLKLTPQLELHSSIYEQLDYTLITCFNIDVYIKHESQLETGVGKRNDADEMYMYSGTE